MTSQRNPGASRPAAERGRRLWNPAKARSKAGLVGLSTAAILSVYAAGYLNTSSGPPPVSAAAIEQAVATATSPTATSTPSASSTGTTSRSVAGTGQSMAPAATPSPAPATAAGYADGTYTGTGTSRHGSIGVTVVVEGGKITSAQVTSCQTRYPCSKVSGLPGQVVARQSASVSYVSGATDSSLAYASAVSQALAAAKI